ncbi:hypothetical protein V5S96_03510 [Corynebacterium mastitidis]|uniref:Uncharacterized protein n=1 Tax=Corynebacterium mastitidis TaxID=161890 RepID=A0ABU8NWN8_9CORY
MTMQPSPSNPIEARKQAARAHLRSMILWSCGGGVAAMGVLFFAPEAQWLVLPLVLVGLVGAFYHQRQVKRILSHRDEY